MEMVMMKIVMVPCRPFGEDVWKGKAGGDLEIFGERDLWEIITRAAEHTHKEDILRHLM
jgi:hypothetical protein